MSALDSSLWEDPWSAFRLPVPLVTNVNGTKSPVELPSYCSDEWIQRLTDLLRLLDVMKKTPISQERESTMKSQMVLARSMMNTIECHFVPSLIDHRTMVDRMEEHELNFHANLEVLLNELRRGTTDICQKYQHSLDLWKSMHPFKPEKQRDFIAEIFLLPEDQSPLWKRSNHDDYLEDEFVEAVLEDSDGSHQEQKGESSAPPSILNHIKTAQSQQAFTHQPQKELDPIEFQKQQQHLLEEELSTLASRLKSSTLAMNATLQSQTRDLEDFESLAQENLDVVSSTTQKVQDRLIRKKGWKKRLATWSLIATIVGMWMLCFMVMRTVPKRKIGSFSFSKWRRKSSNIDDDEYVRENMIAERERRRQEMWRERERLQEENRKKRWQQQQEQYHAQPGHHQQQSHQQQREQCEILSDGTQVCSDASRKFDFKAFSNSDRKAQQLLAERKRHRIEENMANAPLVNAIDSVDNDESIDAAASAAVAAADEKQQMEEAQEEAAEAHRRHVEIGASEATIRSSAEETEQAEGAERHRQIEQDVVLKREAEVRAAAEEAAEANHRQEEVRAPVKDGELGRQEAERLRQIVEEARIRKGAEDRAAEEADEAERREKGRDTKDVEERAAAEEKRRLQEAEQLHQLEEVSTLRKELEARVAEESKRDAKDAERRSEEAERLRQVEEEARLKKEAEDRVAEEAAEAKQRQIELDTKARRREEAERLRQIEEEARLQKEAEASAAAAEKERLERERLEAIKREKLLAEEREKENIKRVRKEASEEANAALQLAKHVNLDSIPTDVLPSDIRFVAGRGNNDLLAYYITARPDMVDASDGSGWRPIHEAARGGNLAGLQLLIDSGCDMSAKTGRGGSGGTALWWAIQRYGEEHDVVRLLRSYGAPADGPDS